MEGSLISPSDPPDGQTPEVEAALREQAHTQIRRDLQVVAEVEALLARVGDSIQRIDAGTFGSCESCGCLIDEAQMESDPTTNRCGDCRRSPVPPQFS